MAGARELATKVRNTTIAALPGGVRVAVTPAQPSAAPTFQVTIHAGSGEHRFVAGWAGEGWPADVERLVAGAPDVEVVFAKQLSRGAKDWLSAHQRGWLDQGGDANVNLSSGLIIFREARKRQVKADTPIKWTRTMLTAAEAVLAGVIPTVEVVESATGISRGASANALARLETLGLLHRPQGTRGRGSARSVVDRDVFLDAYAAAAAIHRRSQRVLRIHRLWKDPLEAFGSEIGPALTRISESWAVTGAAASILLAPYLSNVTVVELYVDDDLFANPNLLANVLGGRVVDRGQLIEVRAHPTPMSADGPVISGIHLALPARIYADLMAVGGRSAEAAHHLRETVDVGPHS
ncbi:MAG: type IV toxin-antitoxin system AbiEi family antitoxin [Acidimicrobiales bacterium]